MTTGSLGSDTKCHPNALTLIGRQNFVSIFRHVLITYSLHFHPIQDLLLPVLEREQVQDTAAGAITPLVLRQNVGGSARAREWMDDCTLVGVEPANHCFRQLSHIYV